MSFANEIIPEPMLEAACVYGFGFIMMQIGLIGTLYVFYRVYQKWAANKSETAMLSLSVRVPFYLAVTDLLLYTDVMAAQIHPALYGTNWTGDTCKALDSILRFLPFQI
jgi:hypothetical protein